MNPIAKIYLNRLIHNFDYIKSHIGTSNILAVVKANAYGHGAVEISKQQQSSNWGSKNLSTEQKQYAASDVIYLHQLKKRIILRRMYDLETIQKVVIISLGSCLFLRFYHPSHIRIMFFFRRTYYKQYILAILI